MAELCKEKTNLDTADVYGRTPLYWALRCNDEKAADMLVDAGAKLTVVDKQHKSILHVAVWAGRLDIARKTVAAGANVNAADDEGYAALHWAAVAENAEIVRFLLEKGANVNAATRSGDTPLLLGLQAKKPELVKALLAAGADPLAVNSEGKSIESERWRAFDKEVEAMLGQAVNEATQKRIDRICRLYSADNPQALKAEAIEPATPNLAALRMNRALFGPDKQRFTSMFVGGERELAVVGALYDATQNYVAFRKELTKAYGGDACAKFDDLKIDSLRWNFTVPLIDEDRLRQMAVEVQGEKAVCRRFPGMEKAGDVHFVRQGEAWRIDASFLAPATQPDANLRLFQDMARTLEKGRGLIGRPETRMEDLKRAMWEEYSGGRASNPPHRDLDKEIADQTEAIRRDPKNAQAYNDRGFAYSQQGKFNEAIADFSEAIRLDPKLTSAYSRRSDAYDVQRNYDKALADATEVIHRDPKSRRGNHRPGQYLRTPGRSRQGDRGCYGGHPLRPQIRQGAQRPGRCL